MQMEQKKQLSDVRPVDRPLCVDMDGTLLRSDLLVEAIFQLLKDNVLYLFMLPVWLLRGKARLKEQIARRVTLDAGVLPYHQQLLAFLRAEHATGRPLVLATASNEKFAHAVAAHLGIFDSVLASDGTTNLSGSSKLARIEALCANRGFDYAGNAMIDLQLWTRADRVIVVNPERGVLRSAEQLGKPVVHFDDRGEHRLSGYLRALRLHQWLKNLLIFVPLLMSHRFGDAILLGQAVVAFIAFGLCASSVYLLNDLLDLPEDRRHLSKRNRPFAAGSVSLIHGAALVPFLLLASLLLAMLLPVEFLVVLATYYAITLAYSLRLKRFALIDVLTLASLYTMRIIAGAAAVAVTPSFWLLAFSMFLFLSLALVKRYTELLTLKQSGATDVPGRGYRIWDLETLSHFGTAAGYMAVLVLALYINSEDVKTLYSRPQVIWLLCPLLLYMVTRIWLLARRDELHEDPVMFVVQDRDSQILALAGAALLWLAV